MNESTNSKRRSSRNTFERPETSTIYFTPKGKVILGGDEKRKDQTIKFFAKMKFVLLDSTYQLKGMDTDDNLKFFSTPYQRRTDVIKLTTQKNGRFLSKIAGEKGGTEIIEIIKKRKLSSVQNLYLFDCDKKEIIKLVLPASSTAAFIDFDNSEAELDGKDGFNITGTEDRKGKNGMNKVPVFKSFELSTNETDESFEAYEKVKSIFDKQFNKVEKEIAKENKEDCSADDFPF